MPFRRYARTGRLLPTVFLKSGPRGRVWQYPFGADVDGGSVEEEKVVSPPGQGLLEADYDRAWMGGRVADDMSMEIDGDCRLCSIDSLVDMDIYSAVSTIGTARQHVSFAPIGQGQHRPHRHLQGRIASGYLNRRNCRPRIPLHLFPLSKPAMAVALAVYTRDSN